MDQQAGDGRVASPCCCSLGSVQLDVRGRTPARVPRGRFVPACASTHDVPPSCGGLETCRRICSSLVVRLHNTVMHKYCRRLFPLPPFRQPITHLFAGCVLNTVITNHPCNMIICFLGHPCRHCCPAHAIGRPSEVAAAAVFTWRWPPRL